MKNFIMCLVAASIMLVAFSSVASAAEPVDSTSTTKKLVEEGIKQKIKTLIEDIKNKVDKTEFEEVKKKIERCLATCQTSKQVRNVRSSVRRTVRRSRRASSGTKAALLKKLDELFERFEDRFDRLDDDHDRLLKGQGEVKDKLDRNARKIDQVKRAIRRSGGECEAGLKVLAELDEDAQALVAREVAKAYPACKGALVLNRTSVVTLCIQHGGETFMSPNGTFVCEKPTATTPEPSERDALQRLDPKADGSASDGDKGTSLALKLTLMPFGFALAGGAMGYGIAAATSPSGERADGTFHANAGVKGLAIGAGTGFVMGLASALIWAAAEEEL